MCMMLYSMTSWLFYWSPQEKHRDEKKSEWHEDEETKGYYPRQCQREYSSMPYRQRLCAIRQSICQRFVNDFVISEWEKKQKVGVFLSAKKIVFFVFPKIVF